MTVAEANFVCLYAPPSGKVWPVGGLLLVSSQRGKGPFGVGCNGVTPTRSSAVNPVPDQRDLRESAAKGFAVAFGFALAVVVDFG